jgi:hypothetical protein
MGFLTSNRSDGFLDPTAEIEQEFLKAVFFDRLS